MTPTTAAHTSLSPTTGSDAATGHHAGPVDKNSVPDAPITREPARTPDPPREVRRQRVSRVGMATQDTFTGKAVLPRDKKADAIKRPHCKPRPKDNRPTGGGGGGRKRFVPWCS